MGASGLGSLLVKEGFLTEQDRLTITKTCGQGSWAFAKSILAIGLLDEDELAGFFAERTRYQIAPKDFLNHLDVSAVQSLDKRLVSKLEIIPLKKDPGKITVGVVDPLDRGTLKQLEFFTGLQVNPVVIPLSQLYEGLARIDPDFKYQPTALTHFLQNHAQSAWVRQKIDSNEDPLGSVPRSFAASPSDIEEIYDDMPEIEEIDEDEELATEIDDDTVGGDPDETEVGTSSSVETSDSFAMSFSEDDGTEEEPLNEAELDPFAGDPLAKEEPEGEGRDNFQEDLASFDLESTAMRGDDLGSLSESAVSLSGEDETQVIAVTDTLASSEILKPENLEDRNPDDASFDEKEDVDFTGVGGVKGHSEEASRIESPSKDEDDHDIDFGVPEFGETSEVNEAARPVPSTAADAFAFEETRPRAYPSSGPDVLDTLGDDEPSLDLAALAKESIDEDILADLHADDDAQEEHSSERFERGDRLTEDLSPSAEPSIQTLTGTESSREERYLMPENEDKFPDVMPPSVAPTRLLRNASTPAFDEDEETHIDLQPSSILQPDEDIELHPRQRVTRESRNSGLNPTSQLNELMIKLSLSFRVEDITRLLEIHLARIGNAGCLIHLASRRQFVWNAGSIVTEELGPAATGPLLRGLIAGEWKAGELRAAESWTQSALKLKIFRDGDWLWAHRLEKGDDSTIFRETAASVVRQVADRLGAG